MLVLSDAEVLRVDFHELREGIHQAAADGHGPAHGHVFIGEFLPRDFRRTVDGRTVLADGPDLTAFRQLDATHEVLRLAGGGAVADGDRLDAVAVEELLDRRDGLDLFVLRRMRIDDRVVQEPALLVQAGDLAAVAEARVDGHRALLAHGGAEQQLAEVLPEHADTLQIGLLLGLPEYFSADRGLQQALVRIGGGEFDLVGEEGGRVALLLAEVVVNLGAAFLGVGVDAHVQVAFVLGPQDGEQVVGGDAVEGHLEVEVAAVFGRLGAVPAGLGDAGSDPAAPENAAQVLPDDRRLAEPFGDDVARTGKRGFGIRDLIGDELACVGFRVARLGVP